jgi:hypothetical protein
MLDGAVGRDDGQASSPHFSLESNRPFNNHFNVSGMENQTNLIRTTQFRQKVLIMNPPQNLPKTASPPRHTTNSPTPNKVGPKIFLF